MARILRRNMTGEDVLQWQMMLRGADFDVQVDGVFGTATEEATKAYQQRHGLTADGVVGNRTWGIAMSRGLDLIDDDDPGESGPNWPPRPTDLQPLTSNTEREQLFGRFAYKAAPLVSNPEGVVITDDWAKTNIVKVVIPQLVGVEGASRDGAIYVHVKIAEQTIMLFQAWEDAGLRDRILTWAGSWVPRYQRGSRTSLSNHAWGTAFDINAAWNMLGRQPALKGRKGSLRELVPIANRHGFFWGGHYRGRSDGMHFEWAKRI